MNKLNLENLELERVKFVVEDDADSILIRIDGDIDMEDPAEHVTPYLLKCHDRLIQSGLKKLSLDFTKLSFMSSSGIRSFVTWFLKLGQIPDEKRYAIKLIYSSNVTWQESSLPVLQKLHPRHISIEPV